MTHIYHLASKLRDKIGDPAEAFIQKHPYLSFYCMAIGMPLLILVLVAVLSTAVILPIAWLCGWL